LLFLLAITTVSIKGSKQEKEMKDIHLERRSKLPLLYRKIFKNILKIAE
jgi:hypothetical protein